LEIGKLEKINETYDKKNVFGYHDALKIYGVPKLCTVCSKMTSFPPTEWVSETTFGSICSSFL
jgi:hypothetical protein